MTSPIRANSVLPARRTPITLHTADGLELVGELAVPEDRDPVATLVCLHPLPTHGGMMDSHIFRKAAFRLPALAGLAVLRFNTRGTWSEQGTSEGAFDNAVGERYDVAAAVEYAEFHDLPDIWLLGWSFGTDLALMHGLDPQVKGAILLSPPLRFSTDADLTRWAESGKPVTALVPEHDDYLQPPEARERFAPLTQAELVPMDGLEAPVGRRRRAGARRGRPPGRAGRRRCRCRVSGTARWRRPTPRPTTRTTCPPTRTSRCPRTASSVRPDAPGRPRPRPGCRTTVLQNRRDRLRDRSSTIASQSSSAQMPSRLQLVGADHVDHRHRGLDRDPVGERIARGRSRAGASPSRRAAPAGGARGGWPASG